MVDAARGLFGARRRCLIFASAFPQSSESGVGGARRLFGEAERGRWSAAMSSEGREASEGLASVILRGRRTSHRPADRSAGPRRIRLPRFFVLRGGVAWLVLRWGPGARRQAREGPRSSSDGRSCSRRRGDLRIAAGSKGLVKGPARDRVAPKVARCGTPRGVAPSRRVATVPLEAWRGLASACRWCSSERQSGSAARGRGLRSPADGQRTSSVSAEVLCGLESVLEALRSQGGGDGRREASKRASMCIEDLCSCPSGSGRGSRGADELVAPHAGRRGWLNTLKAG
jgi:hypothetical protein